MGFPRLEVEAVTVPLTFASSSPLFLYPEPYARTSCVLIFKL